MALRIPKALLQLAPFHALSRGADRTVTAFEYVACPNEPVPTLSKVTKMDTYSGTHQTMGSLADPHFV